jgi:glutathione S-transferase
MYTLTTFRSVPHIVVGFVKDLRVRWALEEAGLPYQLRLIGFADRDTPDYRRQQPFGQVPVLDADGVSMFETGAILMHLGEKSEVLLPADPAGRAQAVVWMFAALNSMEPYLFNLANLVKFSANEADAAERKPALEALAVKKMRELDAWLVDREYLTGQFTAADILMTTVLRMLDDTGYAESFARLNAYKGRCTARPAFQKALADQVALYSQAVA